MTVSCQGIDTEEMAEVAGFSRILLLADSCIIVSYMTQA